jgi:hypothetical protein
MSDFVYGVLINSVLVIVVFLMIFGGMALGQLLVGG